MIEYSKQLYANNASTQLASSVLPADTVITVSNGSSFPQPTPGSYFLVTLSNGVNIEIVKVTGRSGNSLTGCVRGQEGTPASPFSAGTRVELRPTAATLQAFTRLMDLLAPAALLTDLKKPEELNNNSYLVSETDDAGNPIITFASIGRWRFVNYPYVLIEQAIAVQPSTTSLPYSSSLNLANLFVNDGMIVQFTTGLNRGQCRKVRSANASSISWQEPLPFTPLIGDRFEVYQSSTSQYRLLSDQVAILLGETGLGGSDFSGFVTVAALATELGKLTYKDSVRVATTSNIALAGLQTIDGVAVLGGDRVLVKDQSVPSQNGIYVADAGTWVRAADADTSGKVKSGMFVGVNEGTDQKESLWRLETDGAITVGTTDLTFRSVLGDYAKILSPAFTGTPTAPTAAVGNSSTQIANTEFVQRAAIESALVYAIALGG